jgi:pimeloyl-ACP methyl ester carboxylesterase
MDYMQHEASAILPRVLHEAGIEQAVLIGHSDGGSIAAVYAGLAPQSPELIGLVTIAAHFFVEDINIASIQQILQDYETTDLRARLARYHRNVDTAFHGWAGAWLDRRFRAFDITGFLPDIRVPILAMQGENDPYGTDAQLRILKQHARAPAEAVLIPNARHSPHLEAKDRTVEAIATFVAGLQGSQRT